MATLRRKTFPASVLVLVVVATGRADMMLPSRRDVNPELLASFAVAAPRLWPSIPFEDGSVANFPVLPVRGPSVSRGDGEPVLEMQPPGRVLKEGQSSFSLCLYALLGFGLCRSAPLLKKFSFVSIPQWYCDGGPSQIGHSMAISPDCLDPVPVYCFVQPTYSSASPGPLYRGETLVSLWRKSQFTPAILAARAPPKRL